MPQFYDAVLLDAVLLDAVIADAPSHDARTGNRAAAVLNSIHYCRNAFGSPFGLISSPVLLDGMYIQSVVATHALPHVPLGNLPGGTMPR
jgi:hypothetical protein